MQAHGSSHMSDGERALVQTHATEGLTGCGTKASESSFSNGSPVLRNSESRAGFLSTKGHPCTARKVQQALPAWLCPGEEQRFGEEPFFFKDSLASAFHIPEHRGPWTPACPEASEPGS